MKNATTLPALGVEKLTDDERGRLCDPDCTPDCKPSHALCEKALRLIDALTAENERLRAELKLWHEKACNSRADQLAAESRLATATTVVEKWSTFGVYGDLRKLLLPILANQPAAAESRLATATALIRDWINFDFDCPDEHNEATDEEEADGWALEQLYERTGDFLAGQPAAPLNMDQVAEALCQLARLHGCYLARYDLRKGALRTVDGDQPAAPHVYRNQAGDVIDGQTEAPCPAPTRTEVRPHCGDHTGWRSDCSRCVIAAADARDARTEAEQAVLDAMASLTERCQRAERWPEWWPEWVAELRRAELALQGLKP